MMHDCLLNVRDATWHRLFMMLMVHVHKPVALERVATYVAHCVHFMALQVRCLDVPQNRWGCRWACLPVLIIPGPKEPHSLRGYLLPLAASMKRLQHGIPAVVSVSEAFLCKLPRDDAARAIPHSHAADVWQVPVIHHAFLYNITADTPARVKLMNWGWYTAKLGACGWCSLVGSAVSGSAVRFMGYLKKISTVLEWRGDTRARKVHAWDPRLTLTAEEMEDRANNPDTSVPGA